LERERVGDKSGCISDGRVGRGYPEPRYKGISGFHESVGFTLVSL